MTPIELVESDDDREKRGESDATRDSTARDVETLYGEPQHEVGSQPAEQKEAFYGEPQHERVDECRWGEPFPWLLDEDDEDDEDDERPTASSSIDVRLRRLDDE